jgi:CPA1 family monovalent cation:H+ antiporter
MVYIPIILLVSIVVTGVARRRGWQAELIVLCVAGAVSFIPQLPSIDVDPKFLLEIVLPPLLFSSAQNLSSYKFKRLKTSIFAFGFGLIIVTAFVVAFFVDKMAIFMTFPTALLLGAVVSPPDVISAVSIGKRMNLPDRVMVTLTGESLINDAAALTLFSFALTMTRGATLNVALGTFIYTCGVGFAIGLASAFLLKKARKLIIDSALITVFTALSPFLVYAISETVGASGVIAVVVLGFRMQQTSLKANHITRLQEKSLWVAIDTLFEVFVFAYIGLHVKQLIDEITKSRLDTMLSIRLAFVTLIIVIVVRIIFVKVIYEAEIAYNKITEWYFERAKARANKVNFSPDNRYTKYLSSRFVLQRHKTAGRLLGNVKTRRREDNVIAWTGMRGVVTLATAFSIPVILPDGTVFSGRPFIQFTALVIAVGTLLLEGTTLPLLIKKTLPEREKPAHSKDYRKGIRIMNSSAMNTISNFKFKDDEKDHKRRLLRAWHFLQAEQPHISDDSHASLVEIIEGVMEKEREDLIKAADDCEISQETLDELLTRLDLRQALYD